MKKKKKMKKSEFQKRKANPKKTTTKMMMKTMKKMTGTEKNFIRRRVRGRGKSPTRRTRGGKTIRSTTKNFKKIWIKNILIEKMMMTMIKIVKKKIAKKKEWKKWKKNSKEKWNIMRKKRAKIIHHQVHRAHLGKGIKTMKKNLLMIMKIMKPKMKIKVFLIKWVIIKEIIRDYFIWF